MIRKTKRPTAKTCKDIKGQQRPNSKPKEA